MPVRQMTWKIKRPNDCHYAHGTESAGSIRAFHDVRNVKVSDEPQAFVNRDIHLIDHRSEFSLGFPEWLPDFARDALDELFFAFFQRGLILLEKFHPVLKGS